jgi:hypothetical protein
MAGVFGKLFELAINLTRLPWQRNRLIEVGGYEWERNDDSPTSTWTEPPRVLRMLDKGELLARARNAGRNSTSCVWTTRS